MQHVINEGYCFSPFIKIMEEETSNSDINIPEGKIGIATMCSITIDGVLLKNGIPVTPKYGGLLDVINRKPTGFEDIIVYNGTSIDPMKIFISKKMTRVLDAVDTGSGRLLANLREIPMSSVEEAQKVLKSAMNIGIADITRIGEPGKSVLNAPVDSGKIGVVVYAGTNIMAAVEESGINVTTFPISMIMDFKELKAI
jgi:repressor of nif and glnA expression